MLENILWAKQAVNAMAEHLYLGTNPPLKTGAKLPEPGEQVISTDSI